MLKLQFLTGRKVWEPLVNVAINNQSTKLKAFKVRVSIHCHRHGI